MNQLTTNVQASSALPGARDAFFMTTLAGIAQAARGTPDRFIRQQSQSWANSNSAAFETACRGYETGNNAAVAQSETYLTKLETAMPDLFHSIRKTEDSMTGGIANVPAYLSGNPLNMRRRTRIVSEQSPLTILVETGNSAALENSQVQARGSAILALVRILSIRRPIELWLAKGSGNSRGCLYTMARIESAPLDLARAAHVIADPLAYRLTMMCLAHRAFSDGTLDTKESGWNGQWPYGDINLYRANAARIMGAAIGASETLYLPPAHIEDNSITMPDQWLLKMIARYSGETE